IHAGLLVINLISMCLVYFLSRRFFEREAAVVAAATFGFLSLSPAVLGFAAHATQFVLPFALAGILLLLRAIETQRAPMSLESGICLGLAFLMKQPGILFLFFAIVCVLRSRRWDQSGR